MPAFAIANDLNWSVSKRPLFFAGNDGKPVQWDEKVAVVRDDTGRGLGTVSPNLVTGSLPWWVNRKWETKRSLTAPEGEWQRGRKWKET